MIEHGLMITLLGMSVVFCVLGINWFLIHVIGWIGRERVKAPVAAQTQNEKAIIAAITMAVQKYEEENL